MAKTVADKLQIKPGSALWVSDEGMRATIGPLPEPTPVASTMAAASVAVVFAADAAAVHEILGAHRDCLGVPRAFWIAYPKGNRTDINRDSLSKIVSEYGLRPNAQVALDETWSALRFRPLADGEAPFTGGKTA